MDVRVFVEIFVEVDKPIVLPGSLGSIEDVGDAELLEEPDVLHGLFVSYEDAGDHLVTVTAPPTGVQRGEQSAVFWTLPGLDLPADKQHLLTGRGGGGCGGGGGGGGGVLH